MKLKIVLIVIGIVAILSFKKGNNNFKTKAYTTDSIVQRLGTINFNNYSIATINFNKFTINSDSLLSVVFNVYRFVKTKYQYQNSNSCPINHNHPIDTYDSVICKDTLLTTFGNLINTNYYFKSTTEGIVWCQTTSPQFTDSNVSIQNVVLTTPATKDVYEGTGQFNLQYRNSLASYPTPPTTGLSLVNVSYYDSAFITVTYYYINL